MSENRSLTEDERIDRTPVAQDIFCYSPREKAETWHVVVNHDANGIVDRVQCKVSGQIHKYKRRSAKKKTSTAKANPKRQVVILDKGEDLASKWFSGIKAWGDKPVENYNPKTSYRVGDVFLHATFGKGLVESRRENKVDVLFSNQVKTLPSPKPPVQITKVDPFA